MFHSGLKLLLSLRSLSQGWIPRLDLLIGSLCWIPGPDSWAGPWSGSLGWIPSLDPWAGSLGWIPGPDRCPILSVEEASLGVVVD